MTALPIPTRNPRPTGLEQIGGLRVTVRGDTILSNLLILLMSRVTVTGGGIRKRNASTKGRNFSRLRKAGDTVTRCQPNLLLHNNRWISELGSSASGGVSLACHGPVTRRCRAIWEANCRRERALPLFEARRRGGAVAEQGDQTGGAGEGLTPAMSHKRRNSPLMRTAATAVLLGFRFLSLVVPTNDPMQPAPEAARHTSRPSDRACAANARMVTGRARAIGRGYPRFRSSGRDRAPLSVLLASLDSFWFRLENRTDHNRGVG
jgi:hypothetical protein